MYLKKAEDEDDEDDVGEEETDDTLTVCTIVTFKDRSLNFKRLALLVTNMCAYVRTSILGISCNVLLIYLKCSVKI